MEDIELMIPWEREIYLTMLAEDLKEKREEQQRQNNANG
jgi:hypothetical protein|tara:strand:+ start:1199 stop:1315 length:117 start_codon:yes stop_codon:yes gene_type:complete